MDREVGKTIFIRFLWMLGVIILRLDWLEPTTDRKKESYLFIVYYRTTSIA